MTKIGLDIGSESIKIVLTKDNKIINKYHKTHHGLIKESLYECFSPLNDNEEYLIAVSGSNAKLLTSSLNITPFGEIPAIVEGVKYTNPDASTVIEIGSQSSRFITNIKDKAPLFSINEHCAGGTGSFFIDQMSRLGLSIDEYNEVCSKATSIPRLSGRCSVFAKTDIIHRQQEGCNTPDILLGLCYAMIRNYKAVIVKDLKCTAPVVFSGGVAQNKGVIKAIKDVFSLKDEDLIINEDSIYTCAIGCSLHAKERVTKALLLSALNNIKSKGEETSSLPHLENESGIMKTEPKGSLSIPKEGCILGIDIGSTSTDLVLIDKGGNLIHHQYLRTSGDPEGAVKTGLKEIEKQFGKLIYITTGITGSGRTRLGKMMGVDVIKDEITSQAKCASFSNIEADTVFEIGGQDSKYISLKNGEVSDFQMNKICAAGTGSFIEEQAIRMNIPLKDFGDLALKSNNPTNLGERCTVFIETAISSALADNTPLKDIAAGLCHSIVQNYLHKVVGNKKVGNHIVLQGGVAYNKGIVEAFRSVYKDRLSVSPYFPISGAYGVALLALEEKKEGVASTFHGFEKIVSKDNTQDNTQDNTETIKKNISFFEKSRSLLLEDYDGKIDPKKKTVGIPFVLMIHKLFPLANAFFKNLGYNVILTKGTDEEVIKLSQEYAQGETCYPVKLIYGHMKLLIDKKVDYIFIPSIRTMKHEVSKVKNNYGCVYMQSAPLSIANHLHLEEKGITLLNPTFDLDFGKKAMVTSMLSLGKILHKPLPLCLKALLPGAVKVRRHTKIMEEKGVEFLKSLKKDEKVLVLITRNYGLSDPVLNMTLPSLLLEKGYKVLTLSHLPAHNIDISEEYPSLYYPFGQHIISGIKIVAHHPNLYALCLNNHGCGPDTMLSQMIKTEMKDKPYLQLEVDEHFSKVGVITRVEAFLNSIEHRQPVNLPDTFDIKDVTINKTNMTKQIDKESKLFIPSLGNYTPYITQYLKDCGAQDVNVMKKTDVRHLDLGRSETSSKEYLPFTYLTDMSLRTCIENKSNEKNISLLIPETEGAEADGLYARSIRSVLDRKGYSNVSIVSPTLETMYNTENLDLFIRALIMGDLSYMKDIDQTKILSWQDILVTAQSIKNEENRKTIGIVGTPLCITELDDGVLERVEKEGYKLVRSSLAEYLLFMWIDRAIEEKNKKLLKVLNVYKKHLTELSRIMGRESPYDKDLDNLRLIADKALPRFNGGNARYRWAKAISMSEVYSGVLTLAPRYENTETVIQMRGLAKQCKAPIFNVELDGDWDEASNSRLQSFLYYCK